MPEIKYAKEVYESAGRLVLSEAEGIDLLTEYCVGHIKHNGDLYQGCRDYVSEDVLIWTDDRKKWLEKYKIAYEDADKTFNEICGTAAEHLVQKYMKEKRLKIVKEGNTMCNAKLVGIPKSKLGIEIPEGETHRVLFSFREEICIGFIQKFCEEFEPEEIYNDEYGLTFLFNLDKDATEYIDMMGYDFAFSMICDMDQKSEGEAVWRAKETETRVLPIIRCGNSLAINVTPICKNMGLNQGDNVKVTIESVDKE